jgi:hypothetical protein
MRLQLRIFTLVAIMTVSGLAHAERGIVKWVDDKGITHYGDTIPPQYSGRSNSVINKQGRVIKKNKPVNVEAANANDAEIKANENQKRHDRALLAAYTTEEEFDLARDRHLQTDEAAVLGLQQRIMSTKERLEANKKTADKFNQRKKPVPSDVLEDIKGNETEIDRIEAQIKDRQLNMIATRQRFDRDKQRFIELKRDPNAPPPAAKSSDTAAESELPQATIAPVATPTSKVKPADVSPAKAQIKKEAEQQP